MSIEKRVGFVIKVREDLNNKRRARGEEEIKVLTDLRDFFVRSVL